MASASITKRGKRFAVRYRLGGRSYPVQHGGSFATLRDAKIRRDVIAVELAAGRNPAVLLAGLAEASTRPARTFAVVAEEYRESRVDVADETAKSLKTHLKYLNAAFSDRRPETIKMEHVQMWIAASTLKPSSLKRYFHTLRLVLDYAGVDPNPARDRRVRLPRIESTVVSPPSRGEVEAIISHARPCWRLALRTLAETGMRVSELHELEWQDVDLVGSRFRVRGGKTAAARRWVAVPPELLDQIAADTPPDDRTAERRVFPGATRQAVMHVIIRACASAGIARYTTHDLRHRYISVQVARGVPITTISAQVGHTGKAMTLDTYSHVLLNEAVSA
jgi:integrase